MNVDDCLRTGILVKIAPDRQKAGSSLGMALHKLSLAERELKHGIYENAVISAYTAMFHAARALLFKDGFKERSHYAVFVYVNEVYSNKLERRYLNALNSLRLQRHELMYGIEQEDETEKGEASGTIETATEFLGCVKKIVF